MGHIELRDLDDDDLDAVFAMIADPAAREQVAFTATDASDRAAFDAWIARQRAAPDVRVHVVTERGGFAGIVAAFTVEGEREVTFWITRNAQGRGVATEALRLLVSREPDRPLFARVAAHNRSGRAVFERVGFTALSQGPAFAPALGRDCDEVVYTLAPALE